MHRVVIPVFILAVILAAAQGVWAAQPPVPKPTESDPKSKATPSGDFAIGRIEAVRSGTPTVVILQVVEASDSVRRIKADGRLTVEIPPAALAAIAGGAAGIRVGDQIKVDGFVREGRLIVTRAEVLRGK